MKNINNVIDKTDELELLHSFHDSCENKDFYKFINQLDLPDNILMQYTSSLEDAYNESKNCLHCPGLENCPNSAKGYVYTPEKESKIITFSYNACPKLRTNIKTNAYKENIELFEMPKETTEASLKNIYKDDKSRVPIIKYFKEFFDNYDNEEKPKGIYLTGSFGCGKTYIIAAMFNEMAKKNKTCAMVYYPEFLRSLKSSFQTNYNEKFDYIKKADLLLLDDIGAENCSAWSRDEVLGPILQYRMEAHLPTFFTSNLTLEELETSLAITKNPADKVKARRIIERIKQLTTTLELIGKNRRD